MRVAPRSVAPPKTLTPLQRRLIAVGWLGIVLVAFATVISYDWPGLTVVGLATGLVFSRDRSWRGALRVTRDWMGLFTFILLYSISRSVADTLGMPVQEQSVIAIDQVLGFGETWVHRTQRWIDWDSAPVWWEVSFPTVYATHFLASIGALIVLYATNRPRWKQFMSRWVAMSGLGLAGYILLPTVPPWLASERGTVDLVHEGNPRGWSYLEGEAIANLFEFGRDAINPVAAMPSLHAAYPMMLLLFFGPSRGIIGRFLLAGYCLHMGFAIVISGQHWVIDVFAGWALAYGVHRWFCRREERAAEPAPAASPARRVRVSSPRVPSDAVPV